MQISCQFNLIKLHYALPDLLVRFCVEQVSRKDFVLIEKQARCKMQEFIIKNIFINL
jgi:hypothetical protein